MIGFFIGGILAPRPPQTERTIYNQGFGLVKDVRQLRLKKRRQSVAIEDVASSIDPTSVGLRRHTPRNRGETPETVPVLERDYGDGKIAQKSQELTKLDSDTAQFIVDLQPNEVKKIAYTVETKW